MAVGNSGISIEDAVADRGRINWGGGDFGIRGPDVWIANRCVDHGAGHYCIAAAAASQRGK